MDMPGNRASASLRRELRAALRHLYDPAGLGNSPLIDLLQVAGCEDPPSALRSVLLEAIDALRPAATVPPQASAWRVYHILSLRYGEQSSQREVATDLALSLRQLGRLEKQALGVLADYLWNRYGLGRSPAHSPTASATGRLPAEGPTPSQEQELLWLKASSQTEVADAAEMVQAVLKIVLPLARALGVQLECAAPADLPRLAVHVTSTRQALLNIVTAAVQSAPGGRVAVQVEARALQACIDIHATPGGQSTALSPARDDGQDESLGMARKLIALSGGSLELRSGSGREVSFAALATLPTTGQVTVLVIDDNVDTLQLLERYLLGSRYRFVGTANPQEAVTLAEAVAPHIIVMDVMLQGLDGWELLGRLREHPRTSGLPLVMCTILPQEELARTLGAAAFIRKPVTRTAFLAALDQVLGQSTTEYR